MNAEPTRQPDTIGNRWGRNLVWVDHLAIDRFDSLSELFEGMISLVNAAKAGHRKANLMAANVHIANQANGLPRLRRLLNGADMLYCDGAGIILGARLSGNHLPMRFTAADWLLDCLSAYAKAGLTVYFVAGEPGIPEKALRLFSDKVPHHTVVGVHHGYVLEDAALNDALIADINKKQPDILIVGMGCPLQEFWIDDNRDKLNVPVCFAIGATLDYLTGKVDRCPDWMGRAGLEWLFRLTLEPQRMFDRYVVGNPAFMLRVVSQAIRQGIEIHIAPGQQRKKAQQTRDSVKS